jgi:AraC-like DNA-binding protein
MFEEMEQPEGGGGLTPSQREKVLAYASRHIASRPTPNDLAGQVGLSSEYFARQFKKTFGVVPRAWLIQERIRAAAISLVETNDTISELANKLGYEDLFLFSRQFKQVMGCSPRAYRKKCGA